MANPKLSVLQMALPMSQPGSCMLCLARCPCPFNCVPPQGLPWSLGYPPPMIQGWGVDWTAKVFESTVKHGGVDGEPCPTSLEMVHPTPPLLMHLSASGCRTYLHGLG